MTPSDWIEANQKYDSVTFTYQDEYKTIAGYQLPQGYRKTKKWREFYSLLHDGTYS